MKILIVDDNPDDRTVLRYMVQMNGHEAIEAEDGSEGLEKAKSTMPDLIISDALMPVMDGFQFLREVKQDPALHSIPFIFYSSSYREYQDVRLAMALGADSYVIKPVEPAVLWQKIEVLLKAGKTEKIPVVPLIKEDAEYLKRYSQVVATKLEKKLHELERTLAERDQAEAALKTSEERYRRIVDTASEGIWMLDSDMLTTFVNARMADLLGYRVEEMIGQPYSAFMFDEDVTDHFRKMEVRRQGKTDYYERRLRSKDGHTVWTLVSAVPVFDGENEFSGSFGMFTDITERKGLEDQLRQAQKMEAIGTLAGGVAHDFNNILTAIMGYGHIVKMKMKSDDPLQVSLDQILLSADRAAHLTQGLLAFSRKQIINPKPIDVNDIIRRVEKLLRRLIGEDVELSVHPAANDLIIMADAGQIEQVLMNLATNARDAMPGGGALTIQTEEIDLGVDFIAAHGYGKPGKYALISVSDTGQGINEETREKIFDPFFTTKEIGKGTGLGLAIVYGIVKQHEGAINVYSEPGKGTTFKIYLPLIVASVEGPADEIPVPPSGGTESILLAEDDKEVRDLITTILRDFGYRVIEAVDGQEALDKFAARTKEFDLLILDVIMPRKSGREVYDVAKSARPDLAILFISGYAADILVKKDIFEEGIEFLSKPISPFNLLRKIREILDKRRRAG